MSESFATLLDESLSTLEMQPGSIVTGVVLDVDKEWVTVHVGLKSEGVISLDEFRNNDGSVEIESGELALEPQNKVNVEGNDAISLLKLLDLLEENDDIQKVYTNFEIDDEELSKISAEL